MNSVNLKHWLLAFRLRTLPLALASIGMGSFLAASIGGFKWEVLLFCSLTTISLQILSNLANDYGDTINGADSANRKGPRRAVQSGKISPEAMKKAIIIFVALSLVSGVYLLYISLGWSLKAFGFFFLLGVFSILAAIAYTVGKKPYGYVGLGDLSVLIFFGLVGVIGSFYLHTGVINTYFILPALSCGFFSIAVLNINNIRDIESDREAGKRSIPVRIGRKRSVKYHWILIGSGISCALIYTVLNFESLYQLIFLITLPLLIRNGLAVAKKDDAEELDPYLKQMAMTTLLFVITFGLGLVI